MSVGARLQPKPVLVGLPLSAASFFLLYQGMRFSLLATLLAASAALAFLIVLNATSVSVVATIAFLTAIPWTLVGVPGLPGPATALPISVLLVLPLLGILFLRERSAPSLDNAYSSVAKLLPLSFFAILILSTLAGAGGVVRPLLPWLTGGWVAMTLAVTAGREPDMLRRVLQGMLLGVAFVASVDLVVRYTGWVPLPAMASTSTAVLEYGITRNRYSGSFGDYELYGELTAIGLVGLITFAASATTQRNRSAWIIASLPVAMALILTNTRGSALAAVLGIVTSLWLMGRKRLIIGLGGLYLLGSSTLGGAVLVRRFQEIDLGESLPQILNRDGPWTTFLTITRGDLVTPFGHGAAYPYQMIGEYPHNLGLYLLYTTGVVGTLILCTVVLLTIVKNFRQARVLPSAMNCALSGMLLAFVADEVKIEFARLGTYVVFVCCLFGLGFVASRSSVNATPSDIIAVSR